MKGYTAELGKIKVQKIPTFERPEVRVSSSFRSTVSSIYSFCYARKDINLKGKLTAISLLLAMIGLPWIMMGFV